MKSISHVALRALVATATAGVSTWASGDTGDTETLVEIPPPFSTVDYEPWARLVRLWLEHGAPLVGMQPPRACPACGSSSGRSLFTSHDGYPFSECSDCGCWYVPRRIGPALYARFFAVCPEAHDLAEHGFAKRSSDENLAGDLDRIGAYLDLLMRYLPAGEGPRYLDIGAGTGSSLIAARDRGLVAVGVEVVAEALEIAARRGVTMLDAAAGLPSGPFGLISFWESLEHLDDPLGALRASASVLAPQGLVGVTVPNLDSPMTRIMRGDCSFVGGGSDGPGHVNLFGVRQLERLFARAGLSLLYIDGQYSTNFIELAAYLLGRHRGASDLLQESPIRCQLPTSLRGIVNSLGPALALLERRTVLTPIVMAVGCRESDRAAMQGVAEALDRIRDQNIAEVADRLRSGVTDYPALAESLQREVAIRDETLSKMQATMNGMQTELQLLRARHPVAALAIKAARRARRTD